MMNINKFLNLFLVTILFVIMSTAANAKQQDNAKADSLDCKQCHSCPDPSADNVCLKACPSLFTANSTSAHKLIEAPDSMLLDALVDQYGPVHFNHRIHARMSEMYQGCPTCHHFSPEGRIPPCNECHGGKANPANLRQPSLKGAYHRQCLTCHREWSHDTKCVICHLPTDKNILKSATIDTTDIIGAKHPLVTAPTQKTYYTPYKKGPIVTFFHKEHIDLFGLRCVDCHQKENCSYCHDLEKPTTGAKTMEQVHAICSGCHQSNKCDKCHDTKEKPEFVHAVTGWPLNRFHASLDCRACHPTGKKISKLNSNCTSCHGGWNQETFRHAVTGLQLDESHSGLDCGDCHAEKKYSANVNCSNCHDDGRNAKKNPPGKYVKLVEK